MKLFIRSVVTTALAFALLAGPASAASRYPEKEHQPVDYAEMVFTGFDETNLNAALSQLKSLAASGSLEKKNAQTWEQAETLYIQILDELNLLFTQDALAGIQYDANGADQALADASAEISVQGTELTDRCYQTLQMLIGTPYQDILEADAGKEITSALEEYQPLTEDRAALLQEEQRLVQQYDQAVAKPVEVVCKGQVWTEESIETADVDDDTYWEVIGLLEQSRNEEVGEIFRQLVQVRTKIAQDAGYSNYADYAHKAIYSRDYSAQDIQAVWEAVKTSIVPLSAKPLENFTARDIRNLEMRSRSSGEEILDAIQPFMDRIDPELGETFAFMRQYHLYDIERSDAKLPTGYTVALPAYGTAFIFNSPYGDYQDYSDTVHEFGHFNETFHSTQHDLWADFNIDVGEIHSQALELFFTSYADEIFGDYGKVYVGIILYNIIDSVLDGCMYDEFQAEVYQNPDMTLAEINRLFKDISEQYGYEYGPDETEGYFWVDISHTFQSPMYYISYATSALSALDLWLWSLEDVDAAVDTYMDLTVMSLSMPYREAIEQVGLRDIFQEETIPALAEELRAYLDDEPVHRESAKEPFSIWFLVPVAGLAAAFALPYTAIRSRRAKAASQYKEDPWDLE